jgi:lysophospholipase L1-like esterase
MPHPFEFAVRFVRLIPHVLLAVALATLLLIFKEWAYVATYRLYLDHRVDDAVGSTARQRFDLDETGVVPRIVVRDERVSFRAAIGQDSTIRAKVRPAGVASYEIHIRQGGTDTVAARSDVVGPMSVVYPFPTGNGLVDIVSHGELTWSDLRLQRNLRLVPELWCLGILLAGWLMWKRAGKACPWLVPAVARGSHERVWLAALTMVASLGIVLLGLEVLLRAAASRLPDGISALRHDLGEPTQDPRWQSSPRYGQRLRANIRSAANEWRDGDIIRMGFVPPVMSERRIHRYAFHTDGEGFRNAVTREAIEVAALGDSFTDALTMAADAAWPAQLERRLGLVVQNYGTAGFGPQQERLVLQDYALMHHPRVVVLAFFAGNDIRDAERFEAFEHGDHALTQPTLGWPIRDIVIRADMWYLTSVLQAAARALASNSATQALQENDAVGPPAASPSPTGSPSFDRGLFTVSINGHTLRWAFMPPYLNLLNFSQGDLAARRGWALALENIRAMQRASSEAGARFVLMFIPFKSQVYLPLLERTFSGEDLAKALHFSLQDTPALPDVERLSRNRLAQNALMQHFCEEAGIPFLDLTTALQERVESGENMYFPDDSHLNEAGEALTAARLAEFLREQGLIKTSR